MSTTCLRPGRLLRPSLLLFSILLTVACSDSTQSAESAGDDARNAATAASEAAHPRTKPNSKAEAENAPRSPHERPMPAFGGLTLSGTQLEIQDLLGSRVLVFLFNPEVEPVVEVAEAVRRIAELRSEHNFEIVGVGVGTKTATLTRFVQDQKLDFAVIDDSSGRITELFRLRTPLALIGMDAEGYMNFGMGGFPRKGDIAGSVEASLREGFRLPETDGPVKGELLAYPSAPELGVTAMSNGDVLETADLSGRAAVVIFFLHTCPHCHKALGALETILSGIGEDKRPRLVAISLQNNARAVRSALKDLDLDYFDPYLDPGDAAADRWGITGSVPVVIVVDAEGRIRHRSMGWDEKRDAALLRMRVAQVAGAQPPMILDPKGYSGNDVCASCHEQEYATWQFTKHASAYDTLVTHASERRTDCVGCHVVGFEEPGGYQFTQRSTHLENVGCESCHGRGGPHLSPGFVPEGDYAQVCATCHNPTHSLGFDYASFHPRISHGAIAAMSSDERTELVGGAGPSRDLLPTKADYVGSEACQSCHEAEFGTWASSPHGLSLASLEKAGKADDGDCLQCHTTAYGKTGGFPEKAKAAEQTDLARVGCESCHGPGSEHIGEDATRVGTILSLGDKCDSCVILKVCGSCHDDANDPGFEFEVEERIESQRHGTIEAAATRSDSAANHPGHPGNSLGHARPDEPEATDIHRTLDHALLEAAFERLEPRPPTADPS